MEKEVFVRIDVKHTKSNYSDLYDFNVIDATVVATNRLTGTVIEFEGVTLEQVQESLRKLDKNPISSILKRAMEGLADSEIVEDRLHELEDISDVIKEGAEALRQSHALDY